MRGPDAATLDRLTVAEKWLRRCNGYPKSGIQTTRDVLLAMLYAGTDVHVDDEGLISWRDPGATSVAKNRFTAEPVAAEPNAQHDTLIN